MSQILIFLDYHAEVLYSLIVFWLDVEINILKHILKKYTEIKSVNTWFYAIERFFKNKKSCETSLSSSFFAWFLKKNIPYVTF